MDGWHKPMLFEDSTIDVMLPLTGCFRMALEVLHNGDDETRRYIGVTFGGPPFTKLGVNPHIADLGRSIGLGQSVGDISAKHKLVFQGIKSKEETKISHVGRRSESMASNVDLATSSGAIADSAGFLTIVVLRLYFANPNPLENGRTVGR